MNGVVLAETPGITAAILEAAPVRPIDKACEDRLNNSIFNGRAGGFVGGTLLNITTAAFAHMRQQPGEPMIERPVAYPPKANSFIGRLAIYLLNQSLEAAGQDPTTIKGTMGYGHFCNQAEGFYAKEAITNSYPKGRPATVILDHENNVILYGKSEGEHSALLVDKADMAINGIWLPSGVICDYEVDTHEDVVSQGDDTFVSIDSVTSIKPFRISAFPIPHDERDETFKMPTNRLTAGLSSAKLCQYGSMDFMRQRFNEKASSPRLRSQLRMAGLISQKEAESALALT